METAKGIVGRGIALALAAGLWVGCSPRTEIGEAEPDAQAGASDDGNVGGSSGSGGSTTGGVAGKAGQGGSDMFEPADGCFDALTANGSGLPKLGPNNQVFPSVRQNNDPLLNYADQ